jgi:KUP system potassium uptake protein
VSLAVRRPLLPLTLTTLGVVYGDIGTSPLYAMRECFHGSHAVAATEANVLGVLSLIIYSLVLVISVKYIAIVMRATTRGKAASSRSPPCSRSGRTTSRLPGGGS